MLVRYSEPCLNQTLNKSQSCINQTLDQVPVLEILVNLTYINWKQVYSEHESWSKGGSSLDRFHCIFKKKKLLLMIIFIVHKQTLRKHRIFIRMNFSGLFFAFVVRFWKHVLYASSDITMANQYPFICY